MLAVLLAGALTGCNKSKTSDADLTVLDYDKFLKTVDDPKVHTVVVDVRKPEEFVKGHIPNAINIPVLDIYKGDPRLANAQQIVVYSLGWSPRRDDLLSWAAAKKLLALGYNDICDFRGGLTLWAESGGKVIIPDQHDKVVEKADVEVTEDGVNITDLSEEEQAPVMSPSVREEVEADVKEAIQKQK